MKDFKRFGSFCTVIILTYSHVFESVFERGEPEGGLYPEYFFFFVGGGSGSAKFLRGNKFKSRSDHYGPTETK